MGMDSFRFPRRPTVGVRIAARAVGAGLSRGPVYRLAAVLLSAALAGACATPAPPAASSAGTTSSAPVQSSATAPAAPTPPSTPSATAAATPAPAVAEWHRSPGTPPPADWLHTPPVLALHLGSRFILDSRHALGVEVPVWTSTDGLSWERASRSDPSGLGTDLWMYAMIPGGPGLIAVGEDQNDPPTESVEHVWTSTDGQVWTTVASSTCRTGLNLCGIHLIGSNRAGFVMFGITPADAQVSPPATWVSVDAEHWNLVTSGSADEVSANAQAVLSSDDAVTAFLSRGADQPPEVWRSEDLVHWRRLAVLPGPPAGGHLMAVRGPRGLVVTDRTRSIWASVDGLEWHRTAIPAVTWIDGLVADSMGFIATGFREGGSGCSSDFVGKSFVSADGRAWTMVPEQPTFSSASINALFVDRDTVIGVGSKGSRNGTGVIWTADRSALDALMTAAPAAATGKPTSPSPQPTPGCPG